MHIALAHLAQYHNNKPSPDKPLEIISLAMVIFINLIN